MKLPGKSRCRVAQRLMFVIGRAYVDIHERPMYNLGFCSAFLRT